MFFHYSIILFRHAHTRPDTFLGFASSVRCFSYATTNVATLIATVLCLLEFRQGPRSGLKMGGGLNGERSEPRWGSGGLPPENFLRPRPFQRKMCLFMAILIQFL